MKRLTLLLMLLAAALYVAWRLTQNDEARRETMTVPGLGRVHLATPEERERQRRRWED